MQQGDDSVSLTRLDRHQMHAEEHQLPALTRTLGFMLSTGKAGWGCPPHPRLEVKAYWKIITMFPTVYERLMTAL